jgi:N-acetyl-anhydromuramyl-L-alanine amidase AmpD
MSLKKILIISAAGLAIICISLAGAYWYFNRENMSKLSVITNVDTVREAKPNEENQEIIILPDDSNNAERNVDSEVERKNNTEDKKSVNIESDSDIGIKSNIVDWGHQAGYGRNIDTIVIHSSYDGLGNDPYSVSGLIKEYQQYNVAPHYLIDRSGKIYQLVKDSDIAYHAGVSKMPDGRTNVNNFSLGIELMNTKKDSYTQDQYSSLKTLIANIKSKYMIKNLVGHSQIAEGRKDDPWNFDWKKIQ